MNEAQTRKTGEGKTREGSFIKYLFNSEVVYEVVVVLVEAAVQGDAVGVDEQVLQGGHALEAQRALHAVGQVGVVEEHPETKGLRSQGHGLADAP